MAEPSKSTLKPAGGDHLHFLTTETYEQIRQLLAMADLLPDPTQFDVVEIAGKKQFRLRTSPDAPSSTPGGGGAASSSGAFCSIVEDPAASGDWFITGGGVPAVGNKNFNVPRFAISGADDTYLIYIVVNVEVNRSDDGGYFMPDIKTSSDTSLVMASTTSASYPANTLPTVATGLGVIHLLVGEVVVTDGVPVFSPTGCGAFHIFSCEGSLTYLPR